ncbi:hypothetical protein BOTBODRAFT_52616 [Botryobasidium botryosum FD-172 SS1]|uniref:Uncharacterized protein n=1 Tax=Botryobasidium botryosum (strain FD-172 SS1) TaxID=930990 RepID=A0A067MSE5_BOTB1|nr:hypothetical protein BOTBODRAFT_52616 [Botryobasidium botryosum FD-172 SS1]
MSQLETSRLHKQVPSWKPGLGIAASKVPAGYINTPFPSIFSHPPPPRRACLCLPSLAFALNSTHHPLYNMFGPVRPSFHGLRRRNVYVQDDANAVPPPLPEPKDNRPLWLRSMLYRMKFYYIELWFHNPQKKLPQWWNELPEIPLADQALEEAFEARFDKSNRKGNFYENHASPLDYFNSMVERAPLFEASITLPAPRPKPTARCNPFTTDLSLSILNTPVMDIFPILMGYLFVFALVLFTPGTLISTSLLWERPVALANAALQKCASIPGALKRIITPAPPPEASPYERSLSAELFYVPEDTLWERAERFVDDVKETYQSWRDTVYETTPIVVAYVRGKLDAFFEEAKFFAYFFYMWASWNGSKAMSYLLTFRTLLWSQVFVLAIFVRSSGLTGGMPFFPVLF